MKKLLIALLLAALLIPSALAADEYDYDAWILAPDDWIGEEITVRGTIANVLETPVDDEPGQVVDEVFIELNDDVGMLAVFPYQRDEQSAPMSIYVDGKIHYRGVFQGLTFYKTEVGLYLALPVIERVPDSQITAMPPGRELPAPLR